MYQEKYSRYFVVSFHNELNHGLGFFVAILVVVQINFLLLHARKVQMLCIV